MKYILKTKQELMKIADRLKFDNCLSDDGRIVVWPDWFNCNIAYDMVDNGLAINHQTMTCYGHTNFYVI